MLRYIEEKLRTLEKEKLLRTLRHRQSPQGARILIEGKEFVNFGSNDYLGLCRHPVLIEAVCRVSERYGAGSGASRLLLGGSALHAELEAALAAFKRTESAIIFNSGYCLNTGVIPALADEESAIFSDELNHASIIDGIRLSRAKKYIYRHSDVNHLSELLRASDERYKLIITDSVFSMDGDIAPLDEIFELCLREAESVLLYVDDAHATGVLGKGKGSLAHFGLRPEPFVLQMGTLSKALGSFGAFVAGSKTLTDWLTSTARSFIFTTALPPSAVGAALSALGIIENNKDLIDKLWRNREILVQALKHLGMDTGKSQTPIIPILMKDIESSLSLSQYLMSHGIYAPAIRPPSVKTPRLRLTVTAAHTEKDIGALLDALKNWLKRQ